MSEILTHREAGVLTLTFNRLDKKNAITTAMYGELAAALEAAASDDSLRVAVFQGAVEIFTAGNDLEDFMKNAPTSGAIEDRSVYKFMMALSGSTKPVVAAVSGNAVGIGTTLLMHCDLVYAADNAKFSMPFVQLGLCPEFASSLLLTQIAGYPRAAEKLMLGEAFGAQEALEMGLISKVLPVEELRAFAEGQAAKLVALPASSIRVTKELMKAARKAPVSDAIAAENKHFGAMLSSPEAREAFMAFFQKRKPDFKQFA